MYNKAYIDRNIKKQAWFGAMKAEHKVFLIALFFDEMDPIGVVEPDFDWLKKMTGGWLTRDDINLAEFVNDCNNDQKERMRFLDRGSKLWFMPTLFFKGNSNGFKELGSDLKSVSILRYYAQREETRTWFIEQARFNEKLNIQDKCLNRAYNLKDQTPPVRDFIKRVAKAINHNLEISRKSPEAIKEEFDYQCQYCGGFFEDYELEIDHIIPKSKGGKDIQMNKVAACKKCNNAKSDQNVFKFVKNTGLEVLPWLKSRLEKIQKKGYLSVSPSDPFKEKKLKKESSDFSILHYDRTYERKLEEKGGLNLVAKWHGELKQLGWSKSVSPGSGTVWLPPKKETV